MKIVFIKLDMIVKPLKSLKTAHSRYWFDNDNILLYLIHLLLSQIIYSPVRFNHIGMFKTSYTTKIVSFIGKIIVFMVFHNINQNLFCNFKVMRVSTIDNSVNKNENKYYFPFETDKLDV